MKHLPNILTLGNLFCGCVAIAYILTALPYYTYNINNMGIPTYNWVFGIQQMYMGSIFIGIAAVCDLLDGFTARALKVFSPIGKDLDSLADVVSFGVAPSMILFQLLWDANNAEKNAFDISLLNMTPAFLIACFAALRLAKFNVTATQQKSYFIGMPTPAVGLFVATFPIVIWNNPFHLATIFKNKWTLYLLIAFLCWIMVSKIKFFKLVPAKLSFKNAWAQIVLIIVSLVAIFINFALVPFILFLYILLSLLYKNAEV